MVTKIEIDVTNIDVGGKYYTFEYKFVLKTNDDEYIVGGRHDGDHSWGADGADEFKNILEKHAALETVLDKIGTYLNSKNR